MSVFILTAILFFLLGYESVGVGRNVENQTDRYPWRISVQCTGILSLLNKINGLSKKNELMIFKHRIITVT